MVRTWYISIIFVLTLLTSFGVMGFLSQCHQKAVQENHVIQSKIEALNKEESALKNQIHIWGLYTFSLTGFPGYQCYK